MSDLRHDGRERIFPHDKLRGRKLDELLFLIIELAEMQMSAIENLQSDIAQLTSIVAELVDKVQSSDQSPAIQNADDEIKALVTNITNVLHPTIPVPETWQVKLTGETYNDYAARLVAWNSAHPDDQQVGVDETSWNLL